MRRVSEGGAIGAWTHEADAPAAFAEFEWLTSISAEPLDLAALNAAATGSRAWPKFSSSTVMIVMRAQMGVPTTRSWATTATNTAAMADMPTVLSIGMSVSEGGQEQRGRPRCRRSSTNWRA